MSVVRLYTILRLYYLKPDDQHYSIGYVTSTLEINLAIITASVPALWPLARRWFPGMFESLGINRPYLYPDIEVAYATQQQSRASRVLRGKVSWKKQRYVPSGIFGAGNGLDFPVKPTGTHPGAVDRHNGFPLTNVQEEQRGQISTGSSNKRSRGYGGGDDDDDFSLVSGKFGEGSQHDSDRGLRTSFRGL